MKKSAEQILKEEKSKVKKVIKESKEDNTRQSRCWEHGLPEIYPRGDSLIKGGQQEIIKTLKDFGDEE